MMMTVTKVQQAAIEQISTDRDACGVKGVTLEALERKGLIRHEDDGRYSGSWYLTGAGKLLVPGFTVEPLPAGTDPFAGLPGC
jgi:hypothetical protein